MITIPERTHFATKAQLDRILVGARQAGELHLLYWMVEMKVGTSPPAPGSLSWPPLPTRWAGSPSSLSAQTRRSAATTPKSY